LHNYSIFSRTWHKYHRGNYTRTGKANTRSRSKSWNKNVGRDGSISVKRRNAGTSAIKEQTRTSARWPDGTSTMGEGSKFFCIFY